MSKAIPPDPTRSNAAAEMERDPAPGISGAHPAGTIGGSLAGAAAGAAIGMAAGPVGAVVGGVIGAAAGGLAGKGLAEIVNPSEEDAYWREAYLNEPYVEPGQPYDYYATGFRTGWEGRVRHDGKRFDDVESELRAEYARAKGEPNPDWEQGRLAARAAWDRIEDISINSR
ncbi:MAG: hypothetical protein ABIS68_06680 [Casimicrobiaceae bacterium]